MSGPCPWCDRTIEGGEAIATTTVNTLHGLACAVDKLELLLRDIQYEHSRALLELSPTLARRIVDAIGEHPRDQGAQGDQIKIASGKPEDVVTPDVIERLREYHMPLYQRRIDSGSPVVVVAETRELLERWRDMAGKNWLALTPAERGEVQDALYDEGWEFECDDLGAVTRVTTIVG